MVLALIIVSALFVAASSMNILTLPVYFKHKDEMKKFQEYYTKSETMPNVTHCYTSKDGTRWFTFTGLLDIPAKRANDAAVCSRLADLCMTKEYLSSKLVELQSFLSKQNFSAASVIVQDLNIKTNEATEEKTLIALANELFLIEGENPKHSTPESLAKKLKIWEEDEACKAFFLHRALSNIRNIQDLSETDLMNYLNKKAVEEKLERISSSPLSSIS